MKKIVIGILLLSCCFLFGCDTDRFIINTQVKPELKGLAGSVAVQYMLGDLLILDEFDCLKTSQILYLTNPDNEVIFDLKVDAGDCSGVTFEYKHATIECKTQPVKFKNMIDHVDSFPNLSWHTKDGKILSNKTKQTEDKSEPESKGSSL